MADVDWSTQNFVRKSGLRKFGPLPQGEAGGPGIERDAGRTVLKIFNLHSSLSNPNRDT